MRARGLAGCDVAWLGRGETAWSMERGPGPNYRGMTIWPFMRRLLAWAYGLAGYDVAMDGEGREPGLEPGARPDRRGIIIRPYIRRLYLGAQVLARTGSRCGRCGDPGAPEEGRFAIVWLVECRYPGKPGIYIYPKMGWCLMHEDIPDVLQLAEGWLSQKVQQGSDPWQAVYQRANPELYPGVQSGKCVLGDLFRRVRSMVSGREKEMVRQTTRYGHSCRVWAARLQGWKEPGEVWNILLWGSERLEVPPIVSRPYRETQRRRAQDHALQWSRQYRFSGSREWWYLQSPEWGAIPYNLFVPEGGRRVSVL